jgi:hypothetical protein
MRGLGIDGKRAREEKRLEGTTAREERKTAGQEGKTAGDC